MSARNIALIATVGITIVLVTSTPLQAQPPIPTPPSGTATPVETPTHRVRNTVTPSATPTREVSPSTPTPEEVAVESPSCTSHITVWYSLPTTSDSRGWVASVRTVDGEILTEAPVEGTNGVWGSHVPNNQGLQIVFWGFGEGELPGRNFTSGMCLQIGLEYAPEVMPLEPTMPERLPVTGSAGDARKPQSHLLLGTGLIVALGLGVMHIRRLADADGESRLSQW